MSNDSSSTQIKISPILRTRLNQLTSTNPSLSKAALIDLVTAESAQLRMNKSALVRGVEAYDALRNQKGLPGLDTNPNETSNKSTNIYDHLNGSSSNGKPNQQQSANKQLLGSKRVKQSVTSFQFENRLQYKLEEMGGMDEILKTIEDQIFLKVQQAQLFRGRSLLPFNRGFAIVGNAGTGKTLLANSVLSWLTAKGIHCYCFNFGLLQQSGGEAVLKSLFDTLAQNTPSAVLFDSIDEVFAPKSNNGSLQNIGNTLIYQIDRMTSQNIDCMIIATAAHPERLDALLRYGRLGKQISVPNPNEAKRFAILKKVIEKLMVHQDLNDDGLLALAKLSSGFVSLDLVGWAEEAVAESVKRSIGDPQSPKTVTLSDFKKAFSGVRPILKRQGFAEIPSVTLDDVGALEEVKAELIQQIILPMKEHQKFKSLNFQVQSGGVLLFGPPGCGKTMLAKAIANAAGANFIAVQGPQLLKKYVGESQQAVRGVFARARLCTPTIIFFDEFDSLASKRQSDGNQVTERIVNTLLNELNGINERNMIFVIAATNRPDIIDEAVLRSGRIEKHLYVPMPQQGERELILGKITSKIVKLEELELGPIAKQTPNYCGADLNFLVKKAVLNAIAANRDGITNVDMRVAVESMAHGRLSREQSSEVSVLENAIKGFDRISKAKRGQQNAPQDK